MDRREQVLFCQTNRALILHQFGGIQRCSGLPYVERRVVCTGRVNDAQKANAMQLTMLSVSYDLELSK